MATGSRKSTAEQLEALRQKQETLKARLGALESRKKAEDRKRETRRTFIVGTAILQRAAANPDFRETLRHELRAADLRDSERAAISDLIDAEGHPVPAAAATADETEAA